MTVERFISSKKQAIIGMCSQELIDERSALSFKPLTHYKIKVI